jgi:hypothetical protein
MPERIAVVGTDPGSEVLKGSAWGFAALLGLLGTFPGCVAGSAMGGSPIWGGGIGFLVTVPEDDFLRRTQ